EIAQLTRESEVEQRKVYEIVRSHDDEVANLYFKDANADAPRMQQARVQEAVAFMAGRLRKLEEGMEIEPLDVGEIEACLQLLAEREDELCAMEAELRTPVTESELYRDAVGAMESRGRAQDLFSLDRLRHELSLPLAQPLTPRGPAQSNMPSEADPLTLEIRAVEVSSQRALQEKVGAAAGALAARVQSTFGLLEGDLRDLRSQLHLQREGHFAAMDASYEELLTHFGVGALEVAESYRERFEALGREHAAAHRRRKSRRSVNESGLWKTEMNNLFEATL
ncbi:hypothetical protein B484DRAFT_412118, partial [Ochromonadaceae sp. CCMP2298]